MSALPRAHPADPGSAVNLEELRATEWPWTTRGDVIYLNHASTGPIPARSLRAQQEFGARRAEPWRISYDDQFGMLHRVRKLCASLIGAAASEIALMVNTTYGINVAARCLPLEPGDVVVSSDREFPANVYPWMALERARGVVFRRVPCRSRLADEDALLAALDTPRVRVLTISWVSFETGLKLDLARLGAACRERGIYFVVDGMQGLGAAPVDVRACHIDLLACGGQKWLLSPWGTGFVYVRRELVTELEPHAVGWMSTRASEDFTRLCDYDLTYFDDARRFEVITLPFQDIAGFEASLAMFHALGLERVYALVAERAAQIVECASAKGLRLLTPPDPERRAGIVSVIPDLPDVASRRLQGAGVIHSLREGAIRLAPHFYTTAEEIERALRLLVGR
ncbi:MAG TPA: aminotransferase class V-fold PLP-dependent enzyme [Gemmatimonadaceae bacterium]|nr:aminotransferase class V-fold PLP-dependent enzyme [Gemmatimonadaceae bacterium]